MSLLSLSPGGHAALIYETFNEQKQAVLPFIREGLERGEQCVYVCNEQSDDEWCEELQAYGVDVAAEREKGSLIVGLGARWQRTGDLSSIARAGQAWGMIEEALAAHTGIRFAVDMGWTLDAGMPPDNLCHWEATLNPLIEGDREIRVLCLYNLKRHPAESIHAALRTHPTVIARGLSGPNPYYEGPRILQHEPHLNRSDPDPAALMEKLQGLNGALAK
jgi:chemotaxis family two-component system sensor kinase Cph1